MDELELTKNIVDIVADHAGDRQVTKVSIEVGKLSAILPNAVEHCFDECAKGTVLEGAVLDIKEKPAQAQCQVCAEAFQMETLFDRCPACGSKALDKQGGDALKIKRFEYVEQRPVA